VKLNAKIQFAHHHNLICIEWQLC